MGGGLQSINSSSRKNPFGVSAVRNIVGVGDGLSLVPSVPGFSLVRRVGSPVPTTVSCFLSLGMVAILSQPKVIPPFIKP